jgi:L-asparaginase/Glu-tRNA(Gln) amidotransferase subunit D
VFKRVGNAPERVDLKDALQEACARGVVVVAITQCAKGTVSDVYETGRKLLQTGVLPGVDMTPEVSSFVCCDAIFLSDNLIVCTRQTQLPSFQARIID